MSIARNPLLLNDLYQPTYDEQLMDVYNHVSVWDGDLISKAARNDPVDAGHVVRRKGGWNEITHAGVRYAIREIICQ